MNRRQIALKLVLEELEISSQMKTFDERLILQKTVYLAQQKGITLGYHYSWYLHGPYCRDLTADAFATRSEIPAGWFLDEPSKSILAELKAFFSTFKKDKARRFEMLGSVLFAIKTGQAKASDTPKITKLMKDAGKNFSEQEVNETVKTLQSKGFIQAA